jgi:hypothetical protein
MPQTSTRQRKTTGRVMHEFKHGELKSGGGGKGGKVKSRRQAVEPRHGCESRHPLHGISMS